jgi:hypothetical protein
MHEAPCYIPSTQGLLFVQRGPPGAENGAYEVLSLRRSLIGWCEMGVDVYCGLGTHDWYYLLNTRAQRFQQSVLLLGTVLVY